MTTHKEALTLALEALETKGEHHPRVYQAITAIKEALTQEKALQALHDENERLGLYKDAYAHPEQEPVAWKLVPTEPTEEMLKAMDECSTEGYDERLYAGHAASVYMAAIDAATTPPQRTWVGLSREDCYQVRERESDAFMCGVAWAESKLKEKNT